MREDQALRRILRERTSGGGGPLEIDFELTADLTAGGTAAAKLLLYDAGADALEAQDQPDDLEVRDLLGINEASSGTRGWAVWDGVAGCWKVRDVGCF